jgi:outer membrane protein OmpA-like peptidoglycan-associated protein
MKRNLTLLIILALTVETLFAQKVNLVKNGTFEMGRTGFKTDHKLQDGFSKEGEYIVTNNVTTDLYSKGFKNPLPSSGQFLFINGFHYPRTAKRCWYDSISVQPNTTYIFSYSVASVINLNPPQLEFNVNGNSVSKIFYISESNYWQTISTTYTTKSDQTRIEISIVDLNKVSSYGNDFAIDNIVFEPEKETPPVRKEEAIIEIPPVKKEEPIAVITPPVKKEVAVIEIPPAKEKRVVEILPKTKPAVVIPPKEKTTVIIPPKPKFLVVIPPKSMPPVVIFPKPKPLVVIPSKPKLSVIVQPKPIKKDTATQIVAASADFKKDISIDEIKVDQKMKLSHIYFERSKYNLLVTSFPELNDLVTFMKKYPTVRIRLEGHTDNVGNPQRNLELSENRAKEVKKYLVEQGIDENRIECIGYGGQRPTYSNADEKLRAKNRRVEVVIIGK